MAEVVSVYHTRHPRTPWQVVYRDPTRRESSGRVKRVVRWFADESDARTHAGTLRKSLHIEGVSGVFFDANVRADAQAARLLLDSRGHAGVSLVQLAERYAAQVAPAAGIGLPIAPQLAEFLRERREIDGAARLTVRNLRDRCEAWFTRAGILRVADITRESAESIRTREGTAAQTRRNDMNAASAFCSWLVEKRRLDVNPLLGLRRPKIHHATPTVWPVDQLTRLLATAATHRKGVSLAAVAVLNYVGARPSELPSTRLFYGRHPVARVEGGKLRGRANRTVPLTPAAVAWLRLAGHPATVPAFTRHDRAELCTASGLRWSPDVCRHTFISNRLALVDDDAAVAREAGTSVDIIHRHYHHLRTKAEARAWASLRPPARLAPSVAAGPAPAAAPPSSPPLHLSALPPPA